MASTMNKVLLNITQGYIDQSDPTNPPPPDVAEEEVLERVAAQLGALNGMRANGNKLRIPQYLNPPQIALLMSAFHPICLIHTGSEEDDVDKDLLAIYQYDGINEGVYVSNEAVFRQLARQYNFSITTREFEEVLKSLRDFVPRKERCDKPNYIAVNNGIFDYDTKQLIPFSPDLVFLSKSRVNYNPNAQNIIIHNDEDNTDWDVESWMTEISDDPEVVNLLWEIIGAAIRPLVRWKKAAFFYAESGNNGKGTLCELIRNICGRTNCISLSLSNMEGEFRLEGLLHASCIVTDENDVGLVIKKAGIFKTLVSNDVVPINRKFKTVVSYRYYGFMIQCFNEMPQMNDKSDSVYRRQLFIPFTKCFTGAERSYIKDDYLNRQEVLEYVLYRVLNMSYYKLSEPASCTMMLNEVKEANDPIRAFWTEFRGRFSWDLVPYDFLYELYLSWSGDTTKYSSKPYRNNFIKKLKIIIGHNDPDWDVNKNAITTGSLMDKKEPLISEFALEHQKQYCDYTKEGYIPNRNKVAPSYRGIRRK